MTNFHQALVKPKIWPNIRVGLKTSPSLPSAAGWEAGPPHTLLNACAVSNLWHHQCVVISIRLPVCVKFLFIWWACGSGSAHAFPDRCWFGLFCLLFQLWKCTGFIFLQWWLNIMRKQEIWGCQLSVSVWSRSYWCRQLKRPSVGALSMQTQICLPLTVNASLWIQQYSRRYPAESSHKSRFPSPSCQLLSVRRHDAVSCNYRRFHSLGLRALIGCWS